MKQKVTRKKSTAKKTVKRKAVAKKTPKKSSCNKKGFVEFIKCFFKV